MVMGPAAGLVLADLGADVVKVEPIGGDKTRRLGGSGAGYFPMYNRNKKSICLDLKSAEGLEIARRLCDSADVVVENFRTGAMDKLGLGYDALGSRNPRLIYCSEKGFLSGPYENRTALDAQFDAALAKFDGQEVPRPDYWGGYRIVATRIEFWKGRSNRMHDRIEFVRTIDEHGTPSPWKVQRLQP
jgi:hypothetical protein